MKRRVHVLLYKHTSAFCAPGQPSHKSLKMEKHCDLNTVQRARAGPELHLFHVIAANGIWECLGSRINVDSLCDTVSYWTSCLSPLLSANRAEPKKIPPRKHSHSFASENRTAQYTQNKDITGWVTGV